MLRVRTRLPAMSKPVRENAEFSVQFLKFYLQFIHTRQYTTPEKKKKEHAAIHTQERHSR